MYNLETEPGEKNKENPVYLIENRKGRGEEV